MTQAADYSGPWVFVVKQFGNTIPEGVCFRESKQMADRFGVKLWGYFDDDGSYVLTDKEQEDYCETYEPDRVPVSHYSGHA